MFCYVQASNWSNMSRFQENQVMICPACSTCFGSTANSLAFHFFVTAHAGSQVLGCWGFSQVCIFRLIASHELSPVLQSPQLKIEFGCTTNILSINIIYIHIWCVRQSQNGQKTTKRKNDRKNEKKMTPFPCQSPGDASHTFASWQNRADPADSEFVSFQGFRELSST